MYKYLIGGGIVILVIGAIIFYFNKRDETQYQKGFEAGSALEKFECEEKINQINQATNKELNANIKTKNNQSRFISNDSDSDKWLQLYQETRAEFSSQ